MNEKKTYTLQEVAEMFQLTTNKVLYLVRNGQLPKPVIRTKDYARWRAADIDRVLEVA